MKTLDKIALFWDVDRTKIDPVKNEKFILERILAFGDEKDFRWAKETYGIKKMENFVSKSKTLDKRSFLFWRQYFNISGTICVQKQSQRKQSPFWTK